jgi:hypothetical protein
MYYNNKLKEMEKKLLFENSLADVENRNIRNGYDVEQLRYLNEFFKDNGLGQINHSQLHEIVSGDHVKVISTIIKNRIPDVDPITKLKNNKDKILEGQELPRIDPDKISRLRIFINKGYDTFFDFNGEVTLNEARLQTYLDKHRTFTNNPDVLDAYNELNELAERLNSLNEKLNITSINEQTWGASDKFFNSLSKLFRISEMGLQLQQKGFEELVVRNLKSR